MRSNIKLQNRRLLEALYYLDEEVLSDVLADVTVPEPSAPLPRKKAVIRSIKYAALLAACGFKEQYILTKNGFTAVPLEASL